MAQTTYSESRKLLSALQSIMAEDTGQARLDKIVSLTATSMQVEVCSIYLFRDEQTLELCATEGLNRDAVHITLMRIGEGLVGRVARSRKVINTADAPNAPGFRFMVETGEENYASFLGVPILRLGELMGVMVVQSKQAREFTDDEVYAVEVVAMVLAEMKELGAFVGDDAVFAAPHKYPLTLPCSIAQEGLAEGSVYLHEPRVVVTNPISDDPEREQERLENALGELRDSIDKMVKKAHGGDAEQQEILEAYRMFAHSKGWRNRMIEDVIHGMSAEAAVEKEQTAARNRMGQMADAYLRERLHDLDDLSNKLLRLLTGQGQETGAHMPDDPILIARNIGPGELLTYGRRLKGVVLEAGSVGSHASIVARALTIPLVIQAKNITVQALNGDRIIVDGDSGTVHLRPSDEIAHALHNKIITQRQAATRYKTLRGKPAKSLCGTTISLNMNAGILADLPSLQGSGADGVGLFRTELQFLTRDTMPNRTELAQHYAGIYDAAQGKDVVFRTLDIGSDKVLPYMTPQDEPNPAMGWRAVRVGLDKPAIMKMQMQAFFRAANGRKLHIMFPFIAQFEEFKRAKEILEQVKENERKMGHPLPQDLKVGAMLETPSMCFAPTQFFEAVDFISIGGNDLKQFFFAADRENERVRRRYDTLNTSFLNIIEQINQRCLDTNTPVSFCGEDAGRPIEALCFATIGLRNLSMRAASIGPVKEIIRNTDLTQLKAVIDEARNLGAQSVRPAVMGFLGK